VEQTLANWVVEREMREIHTRLEAIEATQRRAPDTGDMDVTERKEVEVEEAAEDNVFEECLLREFFISGA
jgi:hypothetical protein